MKTVNRKRCDLPSGQRGSTLIISMIILILLMLLGVTAMKISDTQFQLAGNLQFEDSAMNNAETAINTAEGWLKTGTNFQDAGFTYATSCSASHTVAQLYALKTDVTPATPCLPGYTSPANDPLTMTWDDNNSFAVVGNPNQRYIIELVSINNRLVGSGQTVGGRASSGCNQVNTYRITARGASARGATKFVQSYYSVLSC
ncbi:MAG: PilX N-terminal domain-containing pilus assembly protein [Gallionella sp.]|jgi:Tfp pilus assembly protein PilX